MKNDKKIDFQKKFDVQKWVDSEVAGYDKCGEYEFCGKCDKSLANPCAEAHVANEGLSLKKSIDIASTEKACEGIGKKFVADYLETTYGAKVEVNRRANKITSGLLPLADTHYVVAGEKKVCFIYVYETEEGGVFFLIKSSAALADALKQKHEKVYKSAFPKAKQTWYSVIVDDNFSAEDVKKTLDALVKENA